MQINGANATDGISQYIENIGRSVNNKHLMKFVGKGVANEEYGSQKKTPPKWGG
jgi:hypothetical protein